MDLNETTLSHLSEHRVLSLHHEACALTRLHFALLREQNAAFSPAFFAAGMGIQLNRVHRMIRAPDQTREVHGTVQLKLEATVDWKLTLGNAALKIEGEGGGTCQRNVGDIKIEVENHYQGVDPEKYGP